MPLSDRFLANKRILAIFLKFPFFLSVVFRSIVPQRPFWNGVGKKSSLSIRTRSVPVIGTRTVIILPFFLDQILIIDPVHHLTLRPFGVLNMTAKRS